MIKNTASQKAGAQMVSATDGSAFTSAVTVYVTGDAGTQAVGSVGSGACVHEGNGYHTYSPAQAETNYDLIAFTFIGTGAIPQTLQVYTRAGDAFTRLGAPAGASVSADVAAVAGRLPAALVSGRIDASVGAMAADTLTASAVAASAVSELQSGLSTLAAADVRAAVGLASANLDTQLDALPTNAELATALGTADDAVLAAVAALSLLDAAGVRAAIGLATANLDTQLGALATSTGLATVAGYIDTEVAAIKAQTDKLTFNGSNQLAANIKRVNDVTLTGDGSATPWGPA